MSGRKCDYARVFDRMPANDLHLIEEMIQPQYMACMGCTCDHILLSITARQMCQNILSVEPYLTKAAENPDSITPADKLTILSKLQSIKSDSRTINNDNTFIDGNPKCPEVLAIIRWYEQTDKFNDARALCESAAREFDDIEREKAKATATAEAEENERVMHHDPYHSAFKKHEGCL